MILLGEYQAAREEMKSMNDGFVVMMSDEDWKLLPIRQPTTDHSPQNAIAKCTLTMFKRIDVNEENSSIVKIIIACTYNAKCLGMIEGFFRCKY